MNGDNQAEIDKIEQEQAREFAREQMAQRAAEAGGRGKFAADSAGKSAKALMDKAVAGELAKKLKEKGFRKIKAQEHSMAGWIIAILLAMTKDLMDIGLLEMASFIDWVVDIIIGVSLFFLFGRSMKLARRLAGSLGPTILEIVPGLGFLPIWTIAVLIMWFNSEKE